MSLSAIDARLEASFAVVGAAREDAVTLSARVLMHRGETLRVRADSTVTVGGKTETADVYRQGDWFYVTANAQSYKSNLSSLIGKYDYAFVLEAILREYPKTVWNNAVYGENSVTLVPNAEAYRALADAMGQALAVEGTPYDVSAAELTLTVSEAYVTACVLTLVLEGGGVAINATVALRISAPGSDVTVTPPSGYQYFPEYGFS